MCWSWVRSRPAYAAPPCIVTFAVRGTRCPAGCTCGARGSAPSWVCPAGARPAPRCAPPGRAGSYSDGVGLAVGGRVSARASCQPGTSASVAHGTGSPTDGGTHGPQPELFRRTETAAAGGSLRIQYTCAVATLARPAAPAEAEPVAGLAAVGDDDEVPDVPPSPAPAPAVAAAPMPAPAPAVPVPAPVAVPQAAAGWQQEYEDDVVLFQGRRRRAAAAAAEAAAPEVLWQRVTSPALANTPAPTAFAPPPPPPSSSSSSSVNPWAWPAGGPLTWQAAVSPPAAPMVGIAQPAAVVPPSVAGQAWAQVWGTATAAPPTATYPAAPPAAAGLWTSSAWSAPTADPGQGWPAL
jgi:hypothetical protein